jgi:acetolactate synthase-1/3 small subunit
METKDFTITVFIENQTGQLARVVSVFSRRHINIESLTASKSSIEGIHRFTIVVHVTEDQVQKLVAQIDKQVDVLKAFYYHPDEIVFQEIALYKVPTHIFSNSNKVENLIRRYNARILEIEPEYIVIEKTGHATETEALLNELKNIGIFEFARSGRVAIVRPMERLNNYLRKIEQDQHFSGLPSQLHDL